jgi:hypothetical protein
MPPMNGQTSVNGPRFRSFSAQHPREIAQGPTLRRHSSFHPGPDFMPHQFLQRPKHAQQVSFDLESPNTLPRKSSSPPCPFASRDFAESRNSSPRSTRSDDSGTLVSTSSPHHLKDLPAHCYNAKCDCHSMTPLELDIRPAFTSPSTSPKPFLGKRLPNMKNAFSSKRRASSSATIAEVEPSMRCELLRSSIDSPNVTPASIVESDSRPGTAGSTSGESYRSAFVRPFMPIRSKTTPLSPRACRPRKFCMDLADNISNRNSCWPRSGHKSEINPHVF